MNTKQLRNTIEEAVKQYHEETGAIIDQISFDWYQCIGQRAILTRSDIDEHFNAGYYGEEGE